MQLHLLKQPDSNRDDMNSYGTIDNMIRISGERNLALAPSVASMTRTYPSAQRSAR